MSDTPLSDPPIRGIVLTHGTMSFGLVDAVRKISGAPEEVLTPLSNEGMGPEALHGAVQEAVGTHPAILFTDLIGGSCAVAARLACPGKDNRRVICGANLPMLLDFVTHRDLPLDALVERLVEKGRESIRALDPPPTPFSGAHRALSGG